MFYLATEQEIKDFLREAKRLISEGKRDFIKRTYDHPSGKKVKWIEAILEIGLTDIEQVWYEVLLLTPSDYKYGPEIDDGRPRDGKVIWIFKKTINSKLTYIKLKTDKRGCVCISFHEDW